MRELSAPAFGVNDVLERVSKTGRIATRQRIASAREALIRAESTYQVRGLGGALHLVAKEVGGPLGQANDEDFLSFYENRMVDPKGRAHAFYERILYVDDGICSLCGASSASEVDHYLPKESVGRLAIVPLNMIPACSECNGYKGEHTPTGRDDALIHPYFDNFRQVGWLEAVVRDGDPLPWFSVRLAAGVTSVDGTRIRRQFELLRLNVLYSRLSGGVLPEYRQNLTRSLGGSHLSGARRIWLERKAIDLEEDFGVNFWKTVALRAWAASDWFIKEGYSAPLDADWVLRLVRG